MRRTSCWLVLVATLVPACGDGGGGKPPPDAAATADAAATPDAHAACNQVVNSGSMVEATQVAEVDPRPAGGTLADGDYHLVGWKVYTGVGGATGGTGLRQRGTSHLVAGVSQYAVAAEGMAPRFETYSLVPNGTGMTMTRTCPDQFTAGVDGYTATASTLVLYDSVHHGALEFATFP